MKIVRLGFLLLICATVVSCGPTNQETLTKYSGEFNKKREQFRLIAESLPPAGSIQTDTPCNQLNPPLVFDIKSRNLNSDIIMYEQLLDPDTKPKLDLLLSDYDQLLVWMKKTGPKMDSANSSDFLEGRSSDLEKTLKATLEQRYLVVHRVAQMIEPRAIDEKTFTPGSATIEGFVVDLSNNKTLCSYKFSANTSSEVEYMYKKDQSQEAQQERLASFAGSSLYEDARKKAIDSLRRVTNATIVVED